VRRFAPLLFVLFLACTSPPAGVDQQPAVAVGTTLHYFAGVVDGELSVLWRTDPGAADPSAVRERVLTVEHAAGYPARGAVSDSGSLAWLRKPDGRHHDPVELYIDGRLVDDAALYLQQPRFVGETLMWLRRWPGEPRVDARGLALQSLDGFDLLALPPGGQPRIVARWDALWVQLDGVAEDRLAVQVIGDDGPRDLLLGTDGSVAATSSSPPLRPRTRGEVGRRWEVEVATVGSDVLWRLHGPEGLDFVLERRDGSRARLVPPGDPAREVTLVGTVR